MGRLEGHTALVVGASRGIGAEIARAYAREGAAVGVSARSAAALAQLADELRGVGAEVEAVVADVTDQAAIGPAVDACEAAVGPVDILVYAAGISTVGPFEEIGIDVWQRLFEVNVLGAVGFAKRVLPGMRERGRGRIVNVASTAAKYGSVNQSPYNATKHALLGLTRCLALETAADGVTVNALCPGFVDTDMLRQAVSDWGAATDTAPEELIEGLVSRVPIGRLLEPGEIAELAVYLASPEAGGMTGQGLTLAGGLILV
jgi:NAD(P)-dependent dehydrogenase (short-subunit alcohol dehydrogenase family)